ncbi:MAG: hypothetical protein WC560_08115 [Syntrophales bacterium]
MKKIGFIDIHPQDLDSLLESLSGSEERQEKNNLFIYVFKKSSFKEYEFEKTIEYPSPAEITDIGEFYLSIPTEILSFRIVKLPFSDKAKLRKVIPYELDSLIMGGSDSVVMDTMILNGDENGFDVLVIYIEKEVLNNIISNLALQDIEPRVVTSIDLHALVKAGQEELARRLINQERLNEFDRISAAAEEMSTPTINLRTGPLAYTKDNAKQGRTLKKTAILSILLALVINSNLAFNTIMTRKEASSIKGEIRRMYVGLFPDDKRIVDELYQMRAHIKDIREKSDALTGVSPLQFLMNLSQRASKGVVYNEIDLGKGLIKIKGEAFSMDEIGKMKIKLSEFLTDISVDVRPATNGKIFFSLVAKSS